MEEEEDKNGDSKKLTCQKNRTIVISKDNNCQKPQISIPAIQSSVNDQSQPLRVYIDLNSFENLPAVSLETLQTLSSAENIEFFVGTRSILSKHKKNTQSAFLTCLAQLSQHLKILRIFSETFTHQIDLALFGTTLSRFKDLQVFSLDFSGSDSFGTELCKVFESIGNSMSDLKELEIKMKKSSSSCAKLLESLGLAINQLQRLNKLKISVYSEFPFAEEGIDSLFKGIESARGLTELAIDIRAILREKQLLSYYRMLRELKNLQTLKLNILTSSDVDNNCTKKLLSAIFSLAQLKYLELETRPLGDLNQHDIEDLVKENFHKLNSLEGVLLRVFDFNRIENQFSSLSIFMNISQENNLKKLKKLDLNISRNQKLPKPRIADVIRQFDSLEELTLVVERGYYGWLHEQGNQEMELFNNSQEIQENKLDDEYTNLDVEDPPETVQELLTSIGSQKKIKKLELLFETGNLIRNQGWEALSNLEEMSDLNLKIGDNSGLSDIYLAAITKFLFHVSNLQVLSLTIGSFQSTSEKGWNMLFRALGRLTELKGIYLCIETHNEVTNYSVDLLASSIQQLKNLVSLEIVFEPNNISDPVTFLQLISSVQFLSKLKILTLVDMTSRNTISEQTHQQTEMTPQTQNEENHGFNIINSSLRGLHNLENLNIYFDAGKNIDMQFSQCLQLCGTISDLEDLKELDINISGKCQVIGVMNSIQKKQLAEYLQSQNTKQKQNPNNRGFLGNQAHQQQASQDEEEVVLTTARGICFVIKNNQNIAIPNNNSTDTISPVASGHSWQFPKDTAKLKLSLLSSSEYPQIATKISSLTSGLRNLHICRKISISFKSTIPHVLPQQSFDSLIQSICTMPNLISIDLQLSTSSLTEENSQNLSILQLHLAKVKLLLTFDPLNNSTQAVNALIKSFILNTNLQNLDLKCYEFFNIFLQKTPNPQKIENPKLIKPLSPNTNFSELKSPSKPSYQTSLEIISPNDILILPQNDNDISNSFVSFIHQKYLSCLSHIGSLLNDSGVTDKFDKLFINLSSKDLQGIQDDQTVHQLFQGIKAQSTLKHLSLIASNGLVFNVNQILNISETISLMNNLQILDLYLKSDDSFTATQALNVMIDLQSIDHCACTIKSTLITLRTSKFQTQIDCPILAIQPMNFTISRENNSTDNFEGNNETHNNNSFPLLCLQLSELFNWFNYLSTPLTSIFIDTNYFLSSNEKNSSQNFKHIDSLKKLAMLVNYPQMNTDIKQLFSMFENSNVLESLDISLSEFMQPSSIRNSGTLLGEELRHLKNLKSLSIKVSHYSFQNDDLRQLSLSLRDMPRLNFLNIEISQWARLSIDALTNLADAIGDLQELETLAFCLSVEKSIPSETCLRVLILLSQSAQGTELNVGRKNSIVVNIDGYFSYRYNSFMLRSCSKSAVQIFSKSQRNYEISLPVSSSEEKKDLEILVNSIMEVFKEQEETIIERLTINLKNDEYFQITTDFLNVLVVFLRKTGKKLSHLNLQIKDLYDNQLQEICNILQIQTNKTQNYSALHTETVTIFVDLPGEFDSYERFLSHLYQYLESTTTLRLSLGLPRDGLGRLGKLAKRRMKRLVRLQQSKYQFF